VRRIVLGLAAGILVPAVSASCVGTEDRGRQETRFNNSPGQESAPADTSVQDALDAAGVTDHMAEQLIAVANENGYGPADKTFAALMIDACRDAESGHMSFEEMIAQDAADAAGLAEAQQFYSYLANEYCPKLKDPASATTATATPADANGTRGLMTPLGSLKERLAPADLQVCEKVIGAADGQAVAYTFGPGAVVCADVQTSGAFANVPSTLDVLFHPAVPIARARAVAGALLPKDASYVARKHGSNPPWAHRDGSCLALLFTSVALGEQVQRMHPEGSNDDDAVALLYSDRQTDYGSSADFSGKVRLMSISTGGYNFRRDDVVTC
jgi:hypothetical protein